MGIDFLDLQFRFERVFKIKLDRTRSGNFLAPTSRNGGQRGIRVRDLVAWIESRVKEQNPLYDGDVFDDLKTEIANCLGVEESAVTLNSWMVGDLGMS